MSTIIEQTLTQAVKLAGKLEYCKTSVLERQRPRSFVSMRTSP